MTVTQTQATNAIQRAIESEEIQKSNCHDNTSWHYLLALESDFNDSIRYVDLSEKNDDTFSIELARQLVCINTEFETAAKYLCESIDPKSPRGNISDYKSTILLKYPNITKAPVYIDRYKRKVFPFSAWEEDGGKLTWWDAYQHVKHHRNDYFEEATVRSTLESLCALLLLELYQHGIIHPECDKRKGGTVLLRAPGMIEPLFAQPEEDLPDLPRIKPTKQ